jgi:hypothetical protein
MPPIYYRYSSWTPIYLPYYDHVSMASSWSLEASLFVQLPAEHQIDFVCKVDLVV